MFASPSSSTVNGATKVPTNASQDDRGQPTSQIYRTTPSPSSRFSTNSLSPFAAQQQHGSTLSDVATSSRARRSSMVAKSSPIFIQSSNQLQSQSSSLPKSPRGFFRSVVSQNDNENDHLQSDMARLRSMNDSSDSLPNNESDDDDDSLSDERKKKQMSKLYQIIEELQQSRRRRNSLIYGSNTSSIQDQFAIGQNLLSFSSSPLNHVLLLPSASSIVTSPPSAIPHFTSSSPVFLSSLATYSSSLPNSPPTDPTKKRHYISSHLKKFWRRSTSSGQIAGSIPGVNNQLSSPSRPSIVPPLFSPRGGSSATLLPDHSAPNFSTYESNEKLREERKLLERFGRHPPTSTVLNTPRSSGGLTPRTPRTGNLTPRTPRRQDAIEESLTSPRQLNSPSNALSSISQANTPRDMSDSPSYPQTVDYMMDDITFLDSPTPENITKLLEARFNKKDGSNKKSPLFYTYLGDMLSMY